jgi:predicted TIM-barrel fold metal-dependent hydrolase
MIVCDSHVHIFGPRSRYPQIQTRAYTAGEAPVETLRRHAIPLGITRFVVVQASVNGTDNSGVLDALDVLQQNGRGVIVVDPLTVTPKELDDMYDRGARGLRINLYSGYSRSGRGDVDAQRVGHQLEALSGIAPDGWHIEVIAPLRVLAESAPLLARSRVPIVLDHYGLPGTEAPQSANGRVLLDLLRERHVWMKLSGPYRAIETHGSDPLSTTPPHEWVRAFVERAPERLVWGSDWPHTPAHDDCKCGDSADPFRAIDYGRMFGAFLMAINEPRTLEGILAANPERLYGFA